MVKTYQLRITDLWKETTSGLSAEMKRIVNDKVENIIKYDPFGQEALHGPLQPLYSYNKFESDNRILYAVCEDCRKRGFTSVNNCIGCNSYPDNTIFLWAFVGHDEYVKLGRQREKAWKKARRKK
jgi:hypothetical protein